MSTPTLDRPPGRPTSAARRDRPFVLVTVLLAAAAALGTGVALASRAPDRPTTTTAAAGTAPEDLDQPAAPAATAPATGGARASGDAGTREPGPRPVDTARNAAVLPDGVHHALIRGVDVARGRITVDVVQRFVDDDAVKAAIEDGKSREEVGYLNVWLRNRNPRLRTLPLAGDLRVHFFHSCDESPDRRAVLRRLAVNARLGVYFYSLTVRDGAVHALTERQINPAC